MTFSNRNSEITLLQSTMV